MDESDQEDERGPKQNKTDATEYETDVTEYETDATEYELAGNSIELTFDTNESDRTNDELAEILIVPKQLSELIGIPHDQVKALHVELIVNNSQPVRLNYALVVDSDHEAQCTTGSRPLPDKGASLHFGHIQHAGQVVQRYNEVRLSPEQTASLYHSLDIITDEGAQLNFIYIQPADKEVRRNDGFGLSPDQPSFLSDLLNQIPDQANPLLGSLILSGNQGSPPSNRSYIAPYSSATPNNQLALTDDISNEPEPDVMESIAATMSSRVFQEPERQDNRYNPILKCTAVVIILAVCLAAYRSRKTFPARKL